MDPSNSSCSISCLDDPCMECTKQCKEHKIGMTRNFDETEHVFTLVAKGVTTDITEKTIYWPKNGCILVKFANISKSCEECTTDLRDHEVFHKVFHFRCKFCRFQFRSIEDSVTVIGFKRTKKNLLMKEEETCSFCFKIFNRKADRTIHEKTAHCLEKPKCDICGRTLQSELTLAKHKKMYHMEIIDVFECDECGKTMSTQEILNRHKKTVHMTGFHSCEMCGLQVSRKNHLKRHMSEVHKMVSNINLDFASADFRKTRRFKCDVCEKAFTREETLKRHKTLFHDAGDKVSLRQLHTD